MTPESLQTKKKLLKVTTKSIWAKANFKAFVLADFKLIKSMYIRAIFFTPDVVGQLSTLRVGQNTLCPQRKQQLDSRLAFSQL